MQPGASSGALLARLASHAAAACSHAAAGLPAQRCLATAAAAAAPSGQGAQDVAATNLPTLTADRRRQLPALLAALRRPGDAAQRLGGLASLAASYRDLSVTLGALQMRQHDLDPLVDDQADLASQLRLQDAAAAATSASPAPEATATATPAAAAAAPPPPPLPRRGTFLPLKDVTQLPEDVAVDGRSEAPAEPSYHPSYMDKISVWAAMQPSHMELSQALMTGIKLFPPTEAAYPTYVDFDAATRLLSHHTSRKRLKLQRKLLRKQDKYQIKTWNHFAGEA
ncbi:hypothetical protein PLESTM_000047600 [Pleodorina starrii]|nr:hypothetical protein PLESTM_000047600 [Pleodorina starrii]